MDGQVNDMGGNLFKPNKSQQILVKAGWRRHSREKRGMMKLVWWQDPIHNEVHGQGDAIIIQRERNKREKAKPKPT